MIATHCICCRSTHLDRSPAVLMPFVAKRAFEWEAVEITVDWGLRDITPGMAYPLCNSLQCLECHVVFLDIRFSDAEMAALYAGYRSSSYAELRERYEPGYKRRNVALNQGIDYVPKIESFLADYIKPAIRVLDWGGDGGRNTPFNTIGNSVDVYDISNKRPLAGINAVKKEDLGKSRYDLIVCSNVLEHVPFPADTLLEIRRLMHPDTVLYVEVPYEDLVRFSSNPIGLNRMKRHWHEHINFFTERSLNLLLDSCELSPLAIRTMEVTVADKRGSVFAIACKKRRYSDSITSD